MSTCAAWVDADLASVADPGARALLAVLRGLPASAWPARAEGGRVEVLAVQNRVAGELRRRIAAAGTVPSWATELRPALEARVLSYGHSNSIKAGAVREAGEAFAARGFEAVALKGFHLAYGIYGEPADRPFGDVDLLVGPADLAAAEEALIALGFSRGPAQTGAGAMEKSFLRELGHGVVLDVDLHWTLMGELSLVREMRPDDAGTRARSVAAFPGIRFPSAEDALVFAAVNLVRHGFRPLGNILDFRELLLRADPAVLALRAAETRTAAALSAGLALAGAIFGAAIPESLARALALPRWQRALFRRLLRPGLLVQPELAEGTTARFALKILSQDGARGVARTMAGLPGIALRRVRGLR
ncbi:MAG: nucleotidyltransferase family protein [Planctomycetota bacterium]